MDGQDRSVNRVCVESGIVDSMRAGLIRRTLFKRHKKPAASNQGCPRRMRDDVFRPGLECCLRFGFSSLGSASLRPDPFDRPQDQLGAAIEVQLLLEVGAVGFYGADAQVQFLGDLLRCAAFADQLEYFQFAVAEV